MKHLKVLKSKKDHEAALKRLSELMDANPKEGSLDADELELLAVLIEQYEEVTFPMDFPDPIQAIKFRMEQDNLKSKDLVPYFGSAPKVSEVLNGKRQLSLSMIRKLSAGLGIPLEVLIQAPVAA